MDQPNPTGDPPAAADSRRNARRSMLAGAAILVLIATAGSYLAAHSGDSASLQSGSAAAEGTPSTMPHAQTAEPGSRGAAVDETQPKLVISRTSPRGVALRAWVRSEPVSWDLDYLPAACLSTKTLVIAALTQDGPFQRMFPLFPDMAAAAYPWTNWIIVANVDAQRVEVTYPDGSTDAMAPVEGISLFAAPTSSDPADSTRTRVVAFDDLGMPRDIEVLKGQDNGASVFFESRSVACTQGPGGHGALPSSGLGPTDPIEAKAAIVTSLARLFDMSLAVEDRLSAVDDPTGVRVAYEEFMTGPFAESARSARYRLADLSFTSPTTAAIRYDILTGPDWGAQLLSPAMSSRLGTMRLVNGAWKVPRSMICADLMVGGGDCGSPAPTTTLGG